MTLDDGHRDREVLGELARQAMRERGLVPDYPPEVQAQVAAVRPPATGGRPGRQDLRDLPWCSIDNDDSRDLDQLTVAEPLAGGGVRVLVAIADVAEVVHEDSAIDQHARRNTTSVYTAGGTFAMLPPELSTDLTSLNAGSERLAVVVALVLAPDGRLEHAELTEAAVRSRAKLTYDSVARWLDGKGPAPAEAARVPGLAANLRLQDDVARKLRALRQENGALELDTTESRLVFADGRLSALEVTRSNRAKELIEDFMITVNGAVARFLAAQGFPAVRRVVHTPRRWDRIVELAAGRGHRLPATPDSRALDHFLAAARAADPPGFPELSLAVIKLLGPGEYTAEVPAPGTGGHFGLAVKDYTHSTAPNRRYPDLVTQRLVKAALGEQGPPYAPGELVALSTHCTRAQDAARKVERQVAKSAAAMLMDDHIGKRFDALVTGAAPKGSWVKLLDPPVEGRLVRGEAGVDVGDRVVVQLLETDVERGFIDFGRVS